MHVNPPIVAQEIFEVSKIYKHEDGSTGTIKTYLFSDKELAEKKKSEIDAYPRNMGRIQAKAINEGFGVPEDNSGQYATVGLTLLIEILQKFPFLLFKGSKKEYIVMCDSHMNPEENIFRFMNVRELIDDLRVHIAAEHKDRLSST